MDGSGIKVPLISLFCVKTFNFGYVCITNFGLNDNVYVLKIVFLVIY